MPEIQTRYAAEYYGNVYQREALDRARANHRRALAAYQGGDAIHMATLARVAVLAYELGQMDMEAYWRDKLAQMGSR